MATDEVRKDLIPSWISYGVDKWRYVKGGTVLGLVRKVTKPMGSCWFWQINVPCNILEPVLEEIPYGSVMTEESARRIVVLVAGEYGLAPRFNLADTIAENIMEQC